MFRKKIASFILFVVATSVQAKADFAPEVSLAELKKHVSANSAFIIDANSEKTFKENHIPGAVHFGKIEKNLNTSLPTDKNKLIIAYCGGPMCTAWEDPAQKAKALGYTNIRHFKGGISEWKKAGEKTASN